MIEFFIIKGIGVNRIDVACVKLILVQLRLRAVKLVWVDLARSGRESLRTPLARCSGERPPSRSSASPP